MQKMTENKSPHWQRKKKCVVCACSSIANCSCSLCFLDIRAFSRLPTDTLDSDGYRERNAQLPPAPLAAAAVCYMKTEEGIQGAVRLPRGASPAPHFMQEVWEVRNLAALGADGETEAQQGSAGGKKV